MLHRFALSQYTRNHEGVEAGTEPHVRLTNGQIHKGGRIEVNYGGQWRPVDGHSLDAYATLVVCRSLGFPAVASTSIEMESGASSAGPLIHLHCEGNEHDVLECIAKESAIQDKIPALIAAVECSKYKYKLTQIIP